MNTTTYRTLAACLLVTVGTVGIASTVVVGCGGDDSGGGQGDASADQSQDTTSGGDVITADVSDAGPGDSPTDTAPDTGVDSAVDSGIDAIAATSYIPSVSAAVCERLRQCCLVGTGAWSEVGCETNFGGNPLTLGQAGPYLQDAGVVFDQTRAAACIAEIQAFPCGLVSAMKSIALQQDCFAAFKGTATNGSACAANIQCVAGEYCSVIDGGAGTCVPLVPIGSACTSVSQCSYLGIGVPANYCDPSSHTCLAQRPVDAGCTNYQQCVTNICRNPGPACSDSYVFTDPGVPGGTCDTYTIKDAGGDGG